MRDEPFGRRIGRGLEYALKPVALIYTWWLRFNSRGAAVYFVTPDAWAILFVYMAPLYTFPLIYFYSIPLLLLAVVLMPIVFLSVLRIEDGRIVHFRTVLFIPYWRTLLPERTEFEIDMGWPDVEAPELRFRFPGTMDCLDYGNSIAAPALGHSIAAALKSQGWADVGTGYRFIFKPRPSGLEMNADPGPGRIDAG